MTRALAGYMTEMEENTAKCSVEDWARNMGDDKRKLQFLDVMGDNLLLRPVPVYLMMMKRQSLGKMYKCLVPP